MATGPEHYKEAERLLAGVAELYGELADENDERVALANATALHVMATMAHTHATLALAAATVGLDAVEGPNGGSATGRSYEDAKAWGDAIGGASDAG